MWCYRGHQILLSLQLEKISNARSIVCWTCIVDSSCCWTFRIVLLGVFQKAIPRLGRLNFALGAGLPCLVRLTQGGASNPYRASSGSSVEVWCRSTLHLHISDTRGVHLVTAGNDRGWLQDRSWPPELEWLLTVIAASSPSVK